MRAARAPPYDPPRTRTVFVDVIVGGGLRVKGGGGRGYWDSLWAVTLMGGW